MRLRGSPVQPATILDVSGSVPPSAAQGLLAAARSPQFARVQAAVTDLIADGYPAQEILLQLQAALLQDAGAADSGGWRRGGAGWVGRWASALWWPHAACTHGSCPSLRRLPPRLPPLRPRAAKGKILVRLSEADKSLVDGSDEFLQLLGAASYAQRVLAGQA